MSESKKEIIWDDDKMDSSYANVVNVSFSAEQFNLLFGVHKKWRQGQQDFVVELQERIMMHPMVAKRLLLVLNQSIKQYEQQVGSLDTDVAGKSAKLNSKSDVTLQ